MTDLTVVDGGKQMDAELYGDFTVNEKTGEAFISQRKLAELCGVNHSTISKHFSTLKIDVKQGVTCNLAYKFTASQAQKGKQEAKNLYRRIAKAGAKAYVYHETSKGFFND